MGRIADPGPALVVGDPQEDVVTALASEGWVPTRWDRRAAEGRVPAPWPTGRGYALAAVRLPRSKDELEMMLHAVASVLDPGGRLLLYGANDEGIKSIARRLAPVFVDVQTVATGGHCRVLSATVARQAVLRSSLAEWGTVFDPQITELPAEWRTYPGVFSHGSLDPGSKLLLGTLPDQLVGKSVLDYGAGTGIIGGVCRARGAQVELIDVDTVALEAARENVPGARVTVGSDLAATVGRRYDLIVSNPPIHRGKAETHDVLDGLMRDAPAHLERRGVLQLVVQKRIPVEAALNDGYRSVERVAEDPVFKVIQARVR